MLIVPLLSPSIARLGNQSQMDELLLLSKLLMILNLWSPKKIKHLSNMKMHLGILVLLMIFLMELTKIYLGSITPELVLKRRGKLLKLLMREFPKFVYQDYNFLPLNLKTWICLRLKLLGEFNVHLHEIAKNFFSHCEKMLEKKLVGKILRSLPKRFDMKITAVTPYFY